MEHPRSAAQRIRPILQAMERSIDSARRKRTHEPEPMGSVNSSQGSRGNSGSASAAGGTNFVNNSHAQAQAAANARIASTMIPANNPAGVIRPGEQPPIPARQQTQPGMLPEQQPARLKAKPKPVSPFMKELDPPAYRQQAS